MKGYRHLVHKVVLHVHTLLQGTISINKDLSATGGLEVRSAVMLGGKSTLIVQIVNSSLR
jgi:hypothetical protein